MADFDSLMYNWHYGVQPRTARLAFTPAQICILKDFVVVLDSSYENLFIFGRRTMQLESQIGTGVCDLPVRVYSISENQTNLMVLVSESLVQMLNVDNIHMESVNNVFEFTFVDIKSRDCSIASLWTDRSLASYLVLWVSIKDNPLIYELFDDNSPKIVFDRLEWVTADRVLLVRATSIPVCFSVFSLSTRCFLNHVVMNFDRGPEHFAISSGNRRLIFCQDNSFILYDTASLKRVMCCECNCALDSIDFISLFNNNFMAVGQLGQHRITRYYANEEYNSVDRVNEGSVNFENYDRFKSVQTIGDELMAIRCLSRDQRSIAVGLVNHFDGNVFQFLKLRLGDVLSMTQSCLVTYSKKTATDKHYELTLFDFTAPITPDDLWPRLKQKMSECRKHKKSLQEYSLSKQRHVQQLMRAKMLELNRRHLNELKRIAKNPIYVSKTVHEESLGSGKLMSQQSSDQYNHSQQLQLAQQLVDEQKQQQQCGTSGRDSLLQLHAIWQSYYQRCSGALRDGDASISTAAAVEAALNGPDSIAETCDHGKLKRVSGGIFESGTGTHALQ